MIPVEKFINVIHEQLLDPIFIYSVGFLPRYSINAHDYTNLFEYPYSSASCTGNSYGRCFWWHEEPIDIEILDQIEYQDVFNPQKLNYIAAEYKQVPAPPTQPTCYPVITDVNLHIFANSEISLEKKQYLKNANIKDWYFFFHGFAALNWYDTYKYLTSKYYKIDKVFICLNHLITNRRSYRLRLLSGLQENKLLNYGIVSAPLLNAELLQKELLDVHSLLSIESKKHILKHLLPIAKPKVLDNVDYNKASAKIPDMAFNALWHIVTETVFYEKKLHLTEKIFKPIVCKRPFILVGSFGNLNYLKRYGFKTFNNWIDESYDDIEDNNLRLDKIIEIINNLCNKNPTELEIMYHEMQEVLEYNFQHFYTNFKNIIVDELVDNFEICLKQYNLGLSERFRIKYDTINFTKVKQLLLS